MAKEHETVADIIAEMRGDGHTGPADALEWVRVKLEHYADRLEAAHKRELSKNASKNGADFGQLGDAAKLREALVQAELFVGNIVRHGHQTLVPGDKCTACDGAEELRDMICAALAEPVRNCDVGTAQEQSARFRKFCKKGSMDTFEATAYCAYECPCGNNYDCKLAWAQMPYEEGGAK